MTTKLSHLVLSLFLLASIPQNLVSQSVQDCSYCPEKICPSVCPGESEDVGPWTSGLDFTYNQTSGNSEVSLLNLKFDSVFDKDRDLFRFEIEHSLGETENEETEIEETNVDYSRANISYNHLYSKDYYGTVGIIATRDQIADVKYRASLNSGIGYYFLKKEKVGLFSLEFGPSYIFEEVGGVTDSYLASRIADRFEYHINDRAKIFQNAEFILSTEDSANYLIIAEAGVETEITAGISVVVKVRSNFDNQPADDREKNDVAIMSGVALNF